MQDVLNQEVIIVFYDRLESMCEMRNIKVTPLLVKLGLSKGSISRWKKGSVPNGEILIKLASSLDCSVDYLLELTDNPEVNI